MTFRKFASFLLLFATLGAGAAFAAELWFEDNNMAKPAGVPADFRDKFARPDSWADARKELSTYMFRANILGERTGVDDAFLKQQVLPLLRQSGVGIALDVGGATWKGFGNRDALVESELDLIARIQRLGGEVRYVSLQSILSKKLFDKGVPVDYPMSQRIADAVDYAKAVQQRFPHIRVGVIDALPSHGKDYESPYRALARAFRDNGLVLDHVILDLPYELVKNRKFDLTWNKVVRVEQFVKRDVGARFGIIATSRIAGYKSNRDFHQAVLAMVENYSRAGGDPDFFLLASWFPHPDATIPDDVRGADFPAMRTVLEVGETLRAFEQERAAGAPARQQQGGAR
jgi:hypothetical protein